MTYRFYDVVADWSAFADKCPYKPLNRPILCQHKEVQGEWCRRKICPTFKPLVDKTLTLEDEGFRIKFTGKVIPRYDRLNIPLKTRKKTIFAVWSDLFHPEVPVYFIIKAFTVMKNCSQHTFLVCTKRPERIYQVLYGPEGNFYLEDNNSIPNVWLGTTIENQQIVEKRVPELLKCKPFKLFLSVEPLLEHITVPQEWLAQIDVVIIGCETGPHARETKEDWIKSLITQCEKSSVKVWVKQRKTGNRICRNTLPEEGLFT